MTGLRLRWGIAIDGAGTVWTSNYFGNSITQVQGSFGRVLSPAGGLGLDAPLDKPYGVAIAADGSLWLSHSGDITLTQMVGVASPVKTPTNGPPQAP